MMIRVLVMIIAMARAFARVDFSYSKCANCKKIPQPADNEQADGRRTAVETFLTRTKVGRKKPYANRTRMRLTDRLVSQNLLACLAG